MKKAIIIPLLLIVLGTIAFTIRQQKTPKAPEKASSESSTIIPNENILHHIVDLKQQKLAFYWQNEQHETYRNFSNLKAALAAKNKTLVFAMNGGMFQKDYSPQGLYIEKGKILAPIDTIQKGYGNFYLQPNGIFYITNTKQAKIVKTTAFQANENIEYATQSGPLLVINGVLHPKLTKGSINVNIRNGVGVLPDGKLLFAMSKKLINFYDFATFFKENGCQNALYLDGYVSKTYLPAQGFEDLDGNFGVMIGEVKLKG